jgi:hypothetical protein
MADEPAGNGGDGGNDSPVESHGTTNFSQTNNQSGVQAPPNVASVSPELLQSIGNLTKATGLMLDNISKINSRLKESEDPADGLLKTFDNIQLRLKSIVTYTSNYEDALKQLLDYNKKFANSGIFSVKTYGDMRKKLKDLQDAQKGLMNKGFFSPESQKNIERAVNKTGDAVSLLEKKMKKTGATAEDALDQDIFLNIVKHLRDATNQTDKLGQSFKRIHLTPITRGIMGINAAMGRSGKVEKFAKYGQIAHQLRETQKARVSGNQTEFQKRRAALAENLQNRAKKGGLNLNIPFDERGKIDFKKLQSMRTSRRGLGARPTGSGQFGDVASALSGKSGLGGFVDRFVGRRVLGNIAEAQSGGKQLGMFGRLGTRLMAEGEGSVTRGIGQAGIGAAESGIGGLSEVAGRAAIPLAIASIVKDVFDHGAMLNQQVEKSLGTSGIFGGGESGQTSLQNVRTNLTPEGMSGLYNRLGESYDKNLKIAQAITESGVSMSSLATGGSRGGAGFQNVKNTSYVGARLAGLDETAATKQTIKLLQQYKQSFEASDAFFDKISKDTRAAGITTTKYIQIIDDVNNQFDRMSKSLDQVTSSMRILGKTGRMSADDVKESLDLLTNNGQKRGYDVRAFLAAQQAGNAGLTAQVVGGQEATVGAQRKNVNEAFKTAGIDISKETIGSADDVARLRQRLANAGGGGSIEKQTASGALDQLDQELARLEAARQFQRKGAQGRTGEAGVGYAASQDILGQNFGGKALEQVAAIQQALKSGNGGKGYSIGDLTSGRANVTSDPALVKLAELLQSDPQMFQKITRTLAATSNSTIDLARSGGLKDETYGRLASIAKGSGIELTGGSAKEQVMNLAKDRSAGGGSEKLALALQKNQDTLLDIANTDSDIKAAANEQASKIDKAEQLNKAREVAVATRPTAEIFADAFANLFNQITRPLTAIADFLERKFGNAADQAAQDSFKASAGDPRLESFMTGFGDTVEGLAKEMNDLKNQDMTGASAADKATHDQQLTLATSRYNTGKMLADSLQEGIQRNAEGNPYRTREQIDRFQQDEINAGKFDVIMKKHLEQKAITDKLNGVQPPANVANQAVAQADAGRLFDKLGNPINPAGTGTSNPAPAPTTNITHNTYSTPNVQTVMPNVPSTVQSGESTPAGKTALKPLTLNW